jgi:hypothetical protein
MIRPPLHSTGLVVFSALCDCGNTIAACRDDYPPGSDTWTALECLVQVVDGLIDALVLGPVLEDAP